MLTEVRDWRTSACTGRRTRRIDVDSYSVRVGGRQNGANFFGEVVPSTLGSYREQVGWAGAKAQFCCGGWVRGLKSPANPVERERARNRSFALLRMTTKTRMTTRTRMTTKKDDN